MVWLNNDGLRVRFGNELAKASRIGSPVDNVAGTHQIIADLRYDEMPAAGAGAAFIQGEPAVAIPAGALLRKATIITTTPFTSGGATTLDVGLADGAGVAIDADGVFAALAKTSMDAVGEEATGAGALMATKLAANSYLTLTVGTASFTAGRAKLIIEYMIP